MHNRNAVSSVRLGTVRDIDAIERIESLCFSDPWSKRAFTDYFENPFSLCFVAEENGAVTGYICLYRLCDEWETVNLAVHPDFRRRGYGKVLLSAVIDSAKRESIKKILLEVRSSNLAARTLYEKTGFCAVGSRKNYYTDPKEDAILMDLILPKSQIEGEEINP